MNNIKDDGVWVCEANTPAVTDNYDSSATVAHILLVIEVNSTDQK